MASRPDDAAKIRRLEERIARLNERREELLRKSALPELPEYSPAMRARALADIERRDASRNEKRVFREYVETTFKFFMRRVRSMNSEKPENGSSSTNGRRKSS